MNYAVQPNDTLASIAASYGVAVADLVVANLATYPALSSTGALQVGMQLTIPQSAMTSGPRTGGVTLLAPVVASTNPPPGTPAATSKLPLILGAAVAAYFLFGRKKKSAPSASSAPVAQNPRRRKKARFHHSYKYSIARKAHKAGRIPLSELREIEKETRIKGPRPKRKLRKRHRSTKRNPHEGFESVRRKVVAGSARRGYPLQDPSGRAVAASIGRRKYGKNAFRRWPSRAANGVDITGSML